MNRREFLKNCAAGAGAGLALSNGAVGAGGFLLSNQALGLRVGAKLPNILFIMSDEHNAGVMGCYGNDIVRTPALDLLARRGVTFENCYTNSPLCVPCRLSFTSGKYISRVGAWSNNCWLPSDDYPSLPRILNAAGYESYLCGKMQYLCGKMHYDRTRRYGLTEIGGNMNNGNKSGTGGRRAADNLTPKDGMSGRFNDFYTADDSSILTHDRKVTAGTIDFLKNRKASDKPFFLISG